MAKIKQGQKQGLCNILNFTPLRVANYCLVEKQQAWVVLKVDNTTHPINHHPMDSMVCFVKTFPLDSSLSGG